MWGYTDGGGVKDQCKENLVQKAIERLKDHPKHKVALPDVYKNLKKQQPKLDFATFG